MRSIIQKGIDLLAFPIRAVSVFETDRWGLSSLATERFEYVSQEVHGFCLDVGCGRNNRFIRNFCKGNGCGVDVFAYEGLTQENLLTDPTRFPFPDCSFDSTTFIANLNHVPRSLRDIELAEAFRCLKPGGNIVVTMGNPLAELAVHFVVTQYDRIFGTRNNVDTERGMGVEEEFFLLGAEIRGRLIRAGFRSIRKKYFVTQWLLNHLYIGWKPKS
jgi:SAM-dependent methyltransferase